MVLFAYANPSSVYVRPLSEPLRLVHGHPPSPSSCGIYCELDQEDAPPHCPRDNCYGISSLSPSHCILSSGLRVFAQRQCRLSCLRRDCIRLVFYDNQYATAPNSALSIFVNNYEYSSHRLAGRFDRERFMENCICMYLFKPQTRPRPSRRMFLEVCSRRSTGKLPVLARKYHLVVVKSKRTVQNTISSNKD